MGALGSVEKRGREEKQEGLEEEAAAGAGTPPPAADHQGSRGGSSKHKRRRREASSCPSSPVRLSSMALVAADCPEAPGMEARAVSVSSLPNEARRIAGAGAVDTPTKDNAAPTQTVADVVISKLLKPRGWTPPLRPKFCLSAADVEELCRLAEPCFAQEPTCLRLRAPIKIYGDLHGQFGDLMRLFDAYGAPCSASSSGDIGMVDYLFLGDYVDRGSHSLEVICLLLALKIKYPRRIHLLRGNHESGDINAGMGFLAECRERLGQTDGYNAWHQLNELFDWLPLAACVDDRLLCMHGGVGRTLRTIAEIDAIQRPITVSEGGELLRDLLWSDPTESDSVTGIQENAHRGPGVCAFGPDRVEAFCQANGLDMIVRAHECVMDGFERFASGRLVTVFSATNYCGVVGNSGALLAVSRDLEVVPKLIQPQRYGPSSPQSPLACAHVMAAADEDAHDDDDGEAVAEPDEPAEPETAFCRPVLDSGVVEDSCTKVEGDSECHVEEDSECLDKSVSDWLRDTCQRPHTPPRGHPSRG
eukprot:jgi/Chlat1/4934/Chrsp31S04854